MLVNKFYLVILLSVFSGYSLADECVLPKPLTDSELAVLKLASDHEYSVRDYRSCMSKKTKKESKKSSNVK